MSKIHIFISYYHENASVAKRVQRILDGFGVRSFLAGENIAPAQDWQDRILEEANEADVFICILCKDFISSAFCVQEMGIAIARGLTTIPLSLDKTVPPGFGRRYQAKEINCQSDFCNESSVNESLIVESFLLGIAPKFSDCAIDGAIKLLSQSGSFRGAESNFKLFHEVLSSANIEISMLTDSQARNLLNVIRGNGQIYEAHLCKQDYIPPLLDKYGHLLADKDFEFLESR